MPRHEVFRPHPHQRRHHRRIAKAAQRARHLAVVEVQAAVPPRGVRHRAYNPGAADCKMVVVYNTGRREVVGEFGGNP